MNTNHNMNQIPTFEPFEPRLLMSGTPTVDSLLVRSDDFGNTMAGANEIYVYSNGSATFTGSLNYAGDADFVEYVASETGLATLRLYSVSQSRLISVFDSLGEAVEIQQSRNGYWLTASFLVTQGQSSYIRVSDQVGATGYFYAQVLPTLAQEFVDASAVQVLGAQQQSASGSLAAGGSDMYTFTAQANGYFEIAMTAADGSSADCYLQVYNDSARLYYTNDNAAYGTTDSRLRIYVREGQTFYVRASTTKGTAGDYDITFTGLPYDDLGNSAEAAAALYTYTTGAATKYGAVDYRSDADVMSYTVRDTGLVRANLSAYYGNLAGAISVTDSQGNTVVAMQAAGAGGAVDIEFSAVAGQQYFFRVEGADNSTGRYVLKVLPTLWQEFLDAGAVDVRAAQSGTVAGRLDVAGRDTYKITVPASGYYELNMRAADGSNVDSYLEVFNDSQQRVAYNDNVAYGTGDSKLRLYVREGQVLYVRASAAKATGGDYTLTFESQPIDDAGNDAARAAALYVSPNGSFLKYGSIQYGDDVDCFAYTAKYSGLVQTTVQAYGYRSELAPVLTVHDANGNELGTAQAGAGGTLSLSFTAVEGQRYFFSVSGADAGLGMYNLKVLPTIWQEFLDAEAVDVPGAASRTLSGSLAAGTSQAYKVTVPASGYYQVNLRAADGSALDSYLEVYTEDQRRVSYNDNASYGQTDSQVRLYVHEGQVLYIRASAAKGTAGDFEITFESQPLDDAGNDAARAAALYTYATGAAYKYANIQYSNDVDTFAYTARHSGLVQTNLAATGYRSSLTAVLTVRDAEGNVMGTASAAAGGALNLGFTAVEGQTYFFSVAGNGTLGTYNMNVLPTVWQDFINATEVNVLGGEMETAAGTLAPNGRTTYKITTPAAGYFEINMAAANGSSLDACLEVYNASQTRVAYSDNVSYSVTDSRVRIYVQAGQTYYVRASAAKGTSGDFQITFESQPIDDFGNRSDRAAALYVAADGSSIKYGNVQYSNDTDVFSYTARHSGLVQIDLSAYGYNCDLKANLVVRDADGNQLAAATAGANGALSLNFTAQKNQQYFFSVSASDQNLGMYSMKVLPTIWQDFLDAAEVDVDAADSAARTGTLAAGEYKTYYVTAPAGGYMQFDLAAGAGSSLDSYVEIYTEDQRRVTYNDNVSYSSKDSRVRVAVAEGQKLYVRISGARNTAGSYSLTLTSQPTDDFGNSQAAAGAMALAASGSGSAVATVNYGTDVDVFKFTATVTGDMSVTMANSGVSDLIAAVRAISAQGAQLAADDATDGSAVITFHVTAGQVYYLSASSVNQTAGRYVLTVNTQADPAPDPQPQPDPTPDPTPEPQPEPEPAPGTPQPGAQVSGSVQNIGGVMRLVITGTNGNDTITLSYVNGNTRLVSGAGTQTFAGAYGYISVYGFAGDDVIRLDYSIMGQTLVYAGDGNDTVYNNSQGSATIYGEAGDDLIVSVGIANDVIYGGSGYDSFWTDTTDTIADISSAETAGKTVHKIASFYQPWTTNTASSDYVSKEINGQNLRDPASGSSYSNQAARPLFVDGPSYDDIRQGSLGDCYYLAALASLSETDPNLITQAITSLGDGTYAVRYYRGGAEVYLRIDADLPTSYARLTPDGETWVMLMEKSYAFFRYGQNSYASIEGGWMSNVVNEVTGSTSSTRWSGGSLTALASYIETNLAAGHSVTAGSYSSSPSPIVGSHAYVVMSIEGSGDNAMVTVYNPWGVDGRSWDSNPNDGLLVLSIAKFQEAFSATVVCNA